MKKVIFYEDELNDEFSTAKIEPRVIDENYKYVHKNPLWNLCSILMQNVFSVPIKVLYSNIKFRIKYIGKEKLRPYKRKGYFIYSNHTQAFADTFIASRAVYPKRNFLIVNPENVSMKFLNHIVEWLGAIPIPTNRKAMKNFLDVIEKRIKQGYSITIFPEAHIWPYYIGIRNFKSVSFKYPVKLDVPVFCITNTYHARGKNKDKVKLITYIDGPFFVNKELGMKEQQEDLRNSVYERMVERSKESNIKIIEYRKKGFRDVP